MTASTRPGPDARTLARPRPISAVGWLLFVAVGVVFLRGGTTGLLGFGAAWLVGFGAIYVLMMRSRVVIDGDVLHARGILGWGPPIDLRRLRRVSVTRGAFLVRFVELHDEDDHHVLIDAVNLRVRDLLAELAARTAPSDPAVDRDARPLLARHR